MSKIRTAFGHRRLRVAGVTALICSAALVMSGCFRAVYDTYVVQGNDVVIKQQYSNLIVWNWAGPACNQDLNGNGIPGGEQDRGWCALRLIRAAACSKLSGWVQNVCNAATADSEWDDFNPAASAQAQPGADCLTVSVNPVADNGFNWTTREVGHGGC
jgi:hypothetical protein